jgi:undecaprenyl-diphosphatase
MKNFLIGVIQGITEFLPISSSGHLVLAQKLLGIEKPGIELELTLHLATLFAVLLFFWNDIKKLFVREKLIRHPIFLLFIGSIPAGFVGILFKDKIETYFETIEYLPYFFILNSFILLSTTLRKKFDKEIITPLTAFIIGIAQAIAILPGVSRSGSTVSTALLFGIVPQTAFSFSFLLSIPAIGGAILLNLKEFAAKDLSTLILPFLSAFLTGLGSLIVLRKMVKMKKIYYFGIYTLLLAILILLFLH